MRLISYEGLNLARKWAVGQLTESVHVNFLMTKAKICKIKQEGIEGFSRRYVVILIYA
jgi:hypothetical protein